jgi:hypothetical protein
MRPPGISDLRKRVMITYNPNSGQSWMVPGSIEDGEDVDQGSSGIQKNRIYFSTDFNVSDGTDLTNKDFPKWPIWDSSPTDTLRVNNYYGNYINDPSSRDRSVSPKGPAFVSNEDIFAVFKDTDLSRYEGGELNRAGEGFPLGFQIEQMIYSWGFGDYADFVFLKYLFIHPKQIAPGKFTDTLFQCWMAGVMDVDIALRTNPIGGAQNDRARYFSEEDTLNLAVQWTNSDRGEANNNFGYLGFNFLESPAVDPDGFIRKDKKQFPVTEQLGLRTMRNWPITFDPLANEDRYNFMSTGQRDGDDGPGDRRLLMATGPFNMSPGDSARIVVGIILGATATGKDATGTTEDMAELIRKVRFAQFVYNNQFRAPAAPDISVIKGYDATGSLYSVPKQGWLPLNNAVVIQWDSTAELTVDTLESGLDFMGYRIYRARRTDLDTFAQDLQTTARKGPLGWKEIRSFPLPVPFAKTGTTVGNTGVPIDNLVIADVIKPGQKRFLVARSPSFVLPWAGYWNTLLTRRPPNYRISVLQNGTLDVNTFDKYDSVRCMYMTSQFDELPAVGRSSSQSATVWGLDSVQAQVARDSLIRLIIDKKIKIEPFKFADTNHVVNTDGSVSITSTRRVWEETNEVRRGLIGPYMHELTNGRQFYDVGDDNFDGVVGYDADPEKSEKLINNVEYYYSIRAYDEGDYTLGTSTKLNLKAVGLSNSVTVEPLGSRPGGNATVEFRIDPDQQAKLGGIYNIKLQITDQQRFNQIFGGHTLELVFYRSWNAIDHDRQDATEPIGLYDLNFYLRDSATGAQISEWGTALPPQLCGSVNTEGYFTENTVTWIDTTGLAYRTDSATGAIYDTVYNPVTGELVRVDTTTFHLPNSTDRIIRSGTYTTTAPCFFNKYALGTVGVSFDYAVEQWGGVYRKVDDGVIVQGGDPAIYVGAGRNDALVYNGSRVLNQPPADFEAPYPGFRLAGNWPTSYNNGPAVYEVTFEPGSTETITTNFRTNTSVGDADNNGKRVTFENVPYLNMKIRNVAEFTRQDVRPDGSTGSATVSYPFDLTNVPVSLDSASQRVNFPNPELVPLGSFAVAAYGWRNSKYGDFKTTNIQYFAADSNLAGPVGSMGKYYLSRALSTTGQDTLDFTHVITIAGAQFCIDWSRFGGRNSIPTYRTIPLDTNYNGKPNDAPVIPSADFKPGDKIRLYTQGGALGFPFNGAKAYARVGQYDPELAGRAYTDEELEQVQVVPNPYYVSHEGTRSPYEGRLYFARLPRKATISIYTTNGELVKTFTHDETTSDDPSTFGTYVWDLLSRNNQRVTSQMLIAKIETPSGASVIRKFTVVVGPARISTE